MAELALIAAIRELLPADPEPPGLGPGDDAAVTVHGVGATVVSVDTVADGVHFRRSTHAPADIGHKAVATALSDLAGMGAPAGHVYVALALPADLPDEDALALARGCVECAHGEGAAVAGGDVVRAGSLVVSVTVIAHVPDPAALVTRSAARPGDVVAVTGALGSAAAGLRELDRDPGADGPAVEAQRRPRPRIAAGAALAQAGAHAMIDVSDGVATDARHLADASGVRIELELDRVPLGPGAGDPMAALAGGEDYELLVCLAPEDVERATAAVAPLALTRLGLVREGAGLAVLDGRQQPVEVAGFEHA